MVKSWIASFKPISKGYMSINLIAALEQNYKGKSHVCLKTLQNCSTYRNAVAQKKTLTAFKLFSALRVR